MITGIKIMMKMVVIIDRQCNSVGMHCICSGSLEEVELQNHHSDPQPHVTNYAQIFKILAMEQVYNLDFKIKSEN